MTLTILWILQNFSNRLSYVGKTGAFEELHLIWLMFEDPLKRKTASQLKSFAKEMCIKRYSGLPKDQMIGLTEKIGDLLKHTQTVNTEMLRWLRRINTKNTIWADTIENIESRGIFRTQSDIW